jgi:RAP domain
MKHRHLRLLGYRVVSVPWYEWDSLQGPAEKHQYLQQRIETVTT